MDAVEFQKVARDTAQINWMAAQGIIARRLANADSCDPEFARKYAKDSEGVAQALPRDKVDLYSNLPVFHIHIGRSGDKDAGIVVDAEDAVPTLRSPVLLDEVWDFGAVSNAQLAQAMAASATAINGDVLYEDEPAPVPLLVLPLATDDGFAGLDDF